MKNVVKVLGLIASVLSSYQLSFLYADDLYLKNAVDEALSQSPRVLKASSATREASWKKTEAYSGFLPSLSASTNYLAYKKYEFTDLIFGGAPVSVPSIIPTSSFNLMAQLPIFDGFASTNNLRSSWASEEAAKDEENWARFQIESEVTLQFFKALSAQALKEVADQNLLTLTDHMKDVSSFKRAGISTNFDVLRVEVQVNEAKSEVMNSEDNFILARNKLAEIIGLQSDARAIKGSLPELDPKILAQEIKVTEGRTDISALENKSRSSALKYSAANRFWVPRISLFGQYHYYNNLNDDYWDKDRYRNAYEVGIALNWNIFDGMASYAKSGEAAEQKVQSEKNLQIARLKSVQDLEFWRRRFLYNCTIYQTRKSNIVKATESVRLAKQGRAAGTITNTDLLDAETELFKARAGAVNAQLGSVEALINLELASGKKLYEFN